MAEASVAGKRDANTRSGVWEDRNGRNGSLKVSERSLSSKEVDLEVNEDGRGRTERNGS
jgi:hypothetical protein